MNEDVFFSQWLWEGGQVVIPLRLLENIQTLNLTPEKLGYIVLAMAQQQKRLNAAEQAQDKWLRWCLDEGWAQWQGKGETRSVSLAPVWKRLAETWEKTRETAVEPAQEKGSFNYSRVLKWLDQERGTLSITLKEKQVIQEFNLKFGWTTEFILIFLQLVFERGHNQVRTYYPIAKKVYQSGIDTVEGLVSFMNELDWIQYKVDEIKKCIGQYGGVTKPQREMYLKWHNKWRFSHELIMRAGEETVRTNSPSFKYIDAILQDWHEKGVKDLQGAEKVLEERSSRYQPPQPTGGRSRRVSQVGNRDIEKLYGLE